MSCPSLASDRMIPEEVEALSLGGEYSSMWEFNSDDGDPDYCEQPPKQECRRAIQTNQPAYLEDTGWEQQIVESQQGADFFYEPRNASAPTSPTRYHQVAGQQGRSVLLTPPEKHSAHIDYGTDQSSYGMNLPNQSNLELPSPLGDPLATSVNYQAALEGAYAQYGLPPPEAQDFLNSPTNQQVMQMLRFPEADLLSDPYRMASSPPLQLPSFLSDTMSPIANGRITKSDTHCKEMKVKLPKFATFNDLGKFGKINMRTRKAWKRQQPRRRKSINDPDDSYFTED